MITKVDRKYLEINSPDEINSSDPKVNCKKADLSFDIVRMMENIEVISVMFYQYITTDITGKPLRDK